MIELKHSPLSFDIIMSGPEQCSGLETCYAVPRFYIKFHHVWFSSLNAFTNRCDLQTDTQLYWWINTGLCLGLHSMKSGLHSMQSRLHSMQSRSHFMQSRLHSVQPMCISVWTVWRLAFMLCFLYSIVQQNHNYCFNYLILGEFWQER